MNGSVPVGPTETGEETPSPWKVEFLGVTTTFEVSHVLEGKTLKVLHFRLKGDVRVKNGPDLVDFRTKGFNIRTKTMKAGVGPPEYLLFLKRRDDGRYEPVSGK